jgi:hypothetical protein
MKIIFLSFGLLLMSLGSPASACDSACQMAQFQAERQPYSGPLSEDRVDTCVRLLSTDRYAVMTEVVLVAGDDPVNGRVITSLGRGNGHSYKLPNQPADAQDVYVREFCFKGSLIAGLTTITFCNGLTPDDGNHHTLSLNDGSALYLRALQNTGHVGDFLTLLGTQRSYNGSVPSFFNQRLYNQRYGRAAGGWLG